MSLIDAASKFVRFAYRTHILYIIHDAYYWYLHTNANHDVDA